MYPLIKTLLPIILAYSCPAFAIEIVPYQLKVKMGDLPANSPFKLSDLMYADTGFYFTSHGEPHLVTVDLGKGAPKPLVMKASWVSISAVKEAIFEVDLGAEDLSLDTYAVVKNECKAKFKEFGIYDAVDWPVYDNEDLSKKMRYLFSSGTPIPATVGESKVSCVIDCLYSGTRRTYADAKDDKRCDYSIKITMQVDETKDRRSKSNKNDKDSL